MFSSVLMNVVMCITIRRIILSCLVFPSASDRVMSYYYRVSPPLGVWEILVQIRERRLNRKVVTGYTSAGLVVYPFHELLFVVDSRVSATSPRVHSLTQSVSYSKLEMFILFTSFTHKSSIISISFAHAHR